MRLGDFILANIEPIMREWEAFARSLPPGENMDVAALRNDAEDILRATARDMATDQSGAQQTEKSQGNGHRGAESRGLTSASEGHGTGRVGSGFQLMEVVAEYRALRASVLRLWRESHPQANKHELDDLTRFNESIDQSLTDAVTAYSKHAEHARQMFLAILAHDLRNPLGSMMMSAQMMVRRGKLDPESSEEARQIADSAAGMGRMIGDLLDFTATTLGGPMPLSPVAMDLGHVCQAVVVEMHAAHPKRTLSFKAQGDLSGEWDAARLRQVVSNLVGNALQHGSETGAVELSASEAGAEVLLTVRNQGPPIPPAVLPNIFDPLVRGSSPELPKVHRTGSIGLGLYIAREIITAHGGRIDVQSSAESGTVFTVRLPRIQTHVARLYPVS